MKKILIMGFGILLLVSMGGLVLWSVQISQDSTRSLAAAHDQIQTLLTEQSLVNHRHQSEIKMLKISLDKTEGLVKQLEGENAQLSEKLKLLDQVGELEDQISRLKERNLHLLNVMTNAQKPAPAKTEDEMAFASVQEGRKLLSKYQGKLKQIKKKMADIRQADRDRFIQAQRERDRIETQLGNNGYLVYNGEVTEPGYAPLPTDIAIEELQRYLDVKVDVTFVK